MDGGQTNVNGRGGGSPELFDLSRLEESLAAPSPRNCRTPEAFLGPTAASLVNLDALIPANPPAKAMNPFLSSRWSRSSPAPVPSPERALPWEYPRVLARARFEFAQRVTPFPSPRTLTNHIGVSAIGRGLKRCCFTDRIRQESNLLVGPAGLDTSPPLYSSDWS